MPKERQKYLQDLKMLNWRPIFYFLKHPLIERQKYPLLLSTETEWLILISPAVAISANSLITSPWSQCCEAIVLTLFVRWRIEIQRFLILKWKWVIFAIKRRTCFHPAPSYKTLILHFFYMLGELWLQLPKANFKW